MISGPLYRNGIKANVTLFIVISAVIAMYFVVVTGMFDPKFSAALEQLTATMPAMPQLMAMFGMDKPVTTLIDFISSYLYGMIMLMFPMIFTIITADRLVARNEDRGFMAYLLAAPASRRTVATTQAAVLITGTSSVVAFATLVGIAAAQGFFPGELDIDRFLLLNLGALTLHLFIAGISFLSSCALNDSRTSSGLGAGIPILAFVIQMLANTSDKLTKARYFTFFTLFNPDGIIAGQPGAVWGMAALAVGAVVLFAAAIAVFASKDIPV